MSLVTELRAQADFEEAENTGGYRTRELMRLAADALTAAERLIAVLPAHNPTYYARLEVEALRAALEKTQ